ncbi:MAG: DNA-binding protein [Candidatus Nanohaloarchaea archaeon]|nr:DNA-binding protein [Candidatus Nanohaloarchaea archaeon]
MAVHVIDANILIHGSSISLPFDDIVTVPGVTEELESDEARRRFDTLEVELREPDEHRVDHVQRVADQAGMEVTETDVALVALADQLDATLVTDDYAMQDLAERLDVSYITFMKEGIDGTVDWTTVCTNCGREVDGEQCPVCGAETTKVPR